MISTIRVLDTPLFNGDISRATESILATCKNDETQNHMISATGAHGIITANQDPYFREVLNSFYMNLPDGMPSVWVGKLKGARQIERCYGPDFFREILVASKDISIRHFFCGGKEGVAEELKHVCEQKFHNQNIAGVYSPPFRELTDEEMRCLSNDINSKNVDIVWIGLSTPKQEKFALRLSKYTKVHFLCTVGAAFDFHTGRLKQAPRWIQKIGMEWFYRLIQEPKRMWKRYMLTNTLFIIYIIREKIRRLFRRNRINY